MISQTAEYALRAIAHLALHTDAPQTAQQISATTKVPTPYLSKVLQLLGRAELIQAQRGLHGGFTLKKSPETLSIFEVIQAVDPLKRIRSCPLGLTAHEELCPLHKRLDAALEQVEQSFRETTFAEVLRERTKSMPLCDFPGVLANSGV
jgi:Rrf2 family protein